MRSLRTTGRVLDYVWHERGKQDEKWGDQSHHPDGTGGDAAQIAAVDARASCQTAFAYGAGTWRHILLEEVYEALAESDKQKLREELIQVAAVSVAWVEKLDRELNE